MGGGGAGQTKHILRAFFFEPSAVALIPAEYERSREKTKFILKFCARLAPPSLLYLAL